MAAEARYVDLGCSYEPRAFWDVATVDAVSPAAQANEQLIVLNSANFFNAQRWPIVIDRITYAPINYLLKRYAKPGGGVPHGFFAASNIFLPRATMAVRLRTAFSNEPMVVSMEATEPSYGGGPPSMDTGRIWSSNFGHVFHRFSQIMELPQDANIEFDLSVFDGVTNAGAPAPVAHARWATAFHEYLHHDIRLGGARVFGGTLAGASAPAQSPFGEVISPVATIPGNLTSSATFPSNQGPTPREFNAQSPIASNSLAETRTSKFYGISVAIDQIDYDDNVAAALLAAAGTSFPACMLAMRIAARARTRGGGTQAWWWREGAPLALVMPTITPASVIKLARPITIAPGDQLEVELRIPPQQLDSSAALAEATYSVGVGFNGYAVVAG